MRALLSSHRSRTLERARRGGCGPHLDVSRAGNEFHFVSLDYEASQSSGRICTGINVDAVGANLRVQHWCVSVHNNFSEVSFVMKKIVANPEQIFFVLLIQRDAGAHPRMNKKEVFADKRNFEEA